MLANYHTHTWRCKHAAPDERAYIEQAIESGIQILGFADHSPYPFPDGHTSSFRMAVDQTEEYFRTLTDLKQEYAGQIEIHIGVEAEYYPSHFDALLTLLRQYPCEYMLMGQHYIGDEEPGGYNGFAAQDPRHVIRYVDQALEGLATGKFTYFAHPDLINWPWDTDLYTEEMTRLCQGVKALNIPLEINLLGLYEKRNYPCRRFWEIAGQVGNTAIIGMDAHSPAALNRPETVAEARSWAAEYGLPVLDTVELRPL